MGYGNPDVYHQPEHFGLTQIGEIDDPFGCYSFDYIVVWQHEDGRLFWAEDSGCSCPSPFELCTALSDLEEITNDSWDAFAVAVRDHCVGHEYAFEREPSGVGWVRDDLEGRTVSRRRWRRRKDDPQAADKTQLLAKVSALLPPRAR